MRRKKHKREKVFTSPVKYIFENVVIADHRLYQGDTIRMKPNSAPVVWSSMFVSLEPEYEDMSGLDFEAVKSDKKKSRKKL